MLDDITQIEPEILEDGSALIPELEAEEEAPPSSHFDNLAESLSDFDLNDLGSDLIDLVEQDRKAREERDKQQEEGIRRTGLGDDAPGGATFDGASKIVHPALAEGCVDFSARAMKELFPAKGPVKTKIYGQADRKKLDKARRKAEYLNWQLTTQIEEYRSEKEILLTQLPLGGSQYEKYWYDSSLGRIRMEFVPVDEVFLPYAAQSFYTSPRKTHMQTLTRHTFEERVRTGFYRDIENLGDPSDDDDLTTASAKANRKIEGKDSSGYNEDGVRFVYEIECWRELEDDERPRPYIVHVDDSSGKVLAIYRNWNEGDEKYKKLDWFVEDKYIPWRGAYGIGLTHLIGSLAGGATGALRALLDSAHINNAPTAIKLKGGRASGQNTQIDITAVQEIEAPAGVDDIRKVIMPMPFNAPSAVLFQLLQFLTDQAKGVVTTSEEKISDVSDRMPVGTALALIEQGSQVFSSIHARLHASQAKALEIICRLNFQFPDTENLARFGLTAEDFKDNDDVQPVSDPNIFSESQRYAQLQEAIKLMGVFPDLKWDKYEFAQHAMQLLRFDNAESILPKPPEPFTGDPVSENREALLGSPIKATPDQDHVSHIQEHLHFLLDPLLGANPLYPGDLCNNVLVNIAQHVVYLYSATALTASIEEMKIRGNHEKAVADGAGFARQFLAEKFPKLAEQLAQAQKMVQEKMPKPPMDPAVQATMQAAMAETERRKAMDQQTMQLKGMEMQQKQASDAQLMQMKQAELAAKQQAQQFEAGLKQQQQQFEQALASQQAQTEARNAQLQGQIELMKNQQDNERQASIELQKNKDDNLTELIIAKIRDSGALAQPQAPQQDLTPHIQEMQRMLSEIEKAKTNEALTTTMEGLRAVVAQLGRPKMIIEDASGKPVGIQ